MEQLGATINGFLATYGLLAIFVVMLLKEMGLPVPIPSDLIMITAGVQAATGVYPLPALILALGVAIFVGGTIQFWIVRGAGRQVLYRFGRYVGLTPARLDRALALLQKRGALAVFLGLNVPGARAGIIPAAGLAKLAYLAFAPPMLGGSGLFYGWHIALGYLIGPSAETLLANIPLLPMILVLGALGLVGWLVLRRWRRDADAAPGETVDLLHSWTHAACPACIAISMAQRLQQGGTEYE